MGVFDEPKIDTHCHVLDPARFPYAPDVAYRPSGQEIAPLEQYLQVMDAYGIRHALFVGPNSGYGRDNRCLQAIAVDEVFAKACSLYDRRAPAWVAAPPGARELPRWAPSAASAAPCSSSPSCSVFWRR